ncbi:hypothetical protein C8J57DRAFT_1366112 [Mycena rebaudengoi]|nr:hypothetical protein C8J57DRAFT_1366112 [Mycena rebaudengoi]
MKHILPAILLSVMVGPTSALYSSNTPRAAARSAETCGDPAHALPFYRIYAASITEHFYTPDVIAVSVGIRNNAYNLEKVAAMVFVTQEESTVPFFRLVCGSESATYNLWTISTTERDDSIKKKCLLAPAAQAYIYPTQICGSVPFYRADNVAKTDILYTTSESEQLDFIANQGFTDMGIAGYVLPAGVACD